jgi:PPP family 3-phenylpropionic acid transporter
MIATIPYTRLSSFYFFYFASLGAFVPLWPVYLAQEIHFSGVQIGLLMAIFMSSKIIAPLMLGWFVDHYGQRLRTIRWLSILTIVCFLAVFIEQSFRWFAVVMFLFGFFWNASLPQFEALTLNHLTQDISRYSLIRLWGSIGFIIAVAAIPPVLNLIGFSGLSLIILGLFIAIAISTLFISDKAHSCSQTHSSDSIWQVLKHPVIIALLLASILQQGSHGAYYTFFSLYLYDHHYSASFVGAMWALGVIAEVGIFLAMQPLMRYFNAYSLFSISVLITAIRWVILAYGVDNTAILIFSQLLHALSYGLFHASAIQIIHVYFPHRLQGRGQALYAGLSFGLGGAIGSLGSGYIWENWGASQTFMMAAGMALIGWFISLSLLRSTQPD